MELKNITIKLYEKSFIQKAYEIIFDNSTNDFDYFVNKASMNSFGYLNSGNYFEKIFDRLVEDEEFKKVGNAYYVVDRKNLFLSDKE